jgi:hypothetical protein
VRVALFVTCLGDTLFPEAPQAAVRVHGPRTLIVLIVEAKT